MTAHDEGFDERRQGPVPPDPWLGRQAAVLRQALAWSGWQIPEATAVWIIQERLDHAVGASGLPADVVRGLMTPEHVRGVAATIADTLARERSTGRGSPARIDGPLGDTFRATG